MANKKSVHAYGIIRRFLIILKCLLGLVLLGLEALRRIKGLWLRTK